MNPGKNMFDPFGLMAGGPFTAWQQSWQVGWRLIENWQRVWLPMMKPVLPMGGLPVLPFGPLAGLVKPMTGMFPFGAVFPQVEASLTPIRGAAGDGEAARLSMRVGLPGAAADEQLSIEALIARRQGRDSPQLGCLQGAEVVYPEVDATSPATATLIDATPVTVTRQVAMAAKPAARKPAKKTAIAVPANDAAAAKTAVAAKPRAGRTKLSGKK